MDVIGQSENYKMMAKALRDYFSPHPYENEILILLLLPTFLILLWLFYSMRPAARRAGTVPASRRDLEFFETARLQKGLETFDRDLLVDLAERSGIRPIYRILLERRQFERALRRSEDEFAQGVSGAPDKKTLDYLRRLQRRIFTSEG
ncbi:MAG TPA: hypothetical protein PLP29_18745 [Candidatus Ozemobacteraceae bacterium]|nr:hypothetical protein [Candidatus Ozemobacteraceae bacterium]